MSSDVPIFTIGQLAQVKGGKRMPSGTALTSQKTSHPYLRIVDFKDGSIDSTRLQYVPDEVFPQIARYVISASDLYISIVGTIGLVGSVPAALDGANLTENAAKICEIDTSRVDARYLSYYLRSATGQSAIRSLTVGSTQPKLALFRIEQIEVPCPAIDVQRAVADLLGALDDRVTVLRQTNTTLEAIAQALFKSWFVDFDPVRAKRDGRAPEGMDEATAALFPDSFEDSELGEVPRGWKICRVEDFADRVGMGPFGSNIKVETFVGSGIPVISGQHLKQFLVEDTVFNFITEEHAERLAKSCVQAGDVIFTHAGSIGQVALLHKDAAFGKYVLSQRQFFLRCRTELMPPEWITQYFKTPTGQHQLLANTSQVGVPSIARPVTYLRSIQLVTPPPALSRKFADVCASITDRVMANRKQITALTYLRDTLLPRLISGQLRLPEAQAFTDEALI